MRTNSWSQEEYNYLAENIKGKSYKEITEELNKKFGKNRTWQAVQNKCSKNHLVNGRNTMFGGDEWKHWCSGIDKDEFKKHFADGYFENVVAERMRKANSKYEIGDIVKKKSKKGETLVKTGNKKDSYTTLARTVWEKANGKIPKGYRLLYLDRDYTNVNLDNLVVVPYKYFALLVQWNKWYAGRKEITTAGIKFCELNYELKELQQELPQLYSPIGLAAQSLRRSLRTEGGLRRD